MDLETKSCGCDSDHVCLLCHYPGEEENDVKKLIIEYLQNLPRCEVTETGTKGRRVGNKWFKAKESEGVGKGDLIVGYWGRYIEMEIKKPGGKRSPEQIERENKIKEAGGQYWVIDNFEDAVTMIHNFYMTIFK